MLNLLALRLFYHDFQLLHPLCILIDLFLVIRLDISKLLHFCLKQNNLVLQLTVFGNGLVILPPISTLSLEEGLGLKSILSLHIIVFFDFIMHTLFVVFVELAVFFLVFCDDIILLLQLRNVFHIIIDLSLHHPDG